MKILVLLIMLSAHMQTKPKTTVYICDAPNAKKYHLKNDCHGLSHCTRRIIGIKLEEAKKRKLELCKFEQ